VKTKALACHKDRREGIGKTFTIQIRNSIPYLQG